MSDLKVLSVQKRAGLGKGANRRARQEELIPGVFYTAKGENLPVQMSVRSFAKLFSQVGRTTVFNLEIEGDGTHPVLIWATQRDPITSRFTHIDFYGVDLDKPVKITVPVEFTGVARGTKVGGKLETYREQIQLMAKPLDMPAKVTIDISGMDVGTTIHRWYLASGNTSPTASSIPRHLSPTMSFTPSRPRLRSHWKKFTQLALSSFMPSAAPRTSR